VFYVSFAGLGLGLVTAQPAGLDYNTGFLHQLTKTLLQLLLSASHAEIEQYVLPSRPTAQIRRTLL